MFEDFIGTERKEVQRIERRDSESGRLKELKEIVVRSRDYFYSDREVEVLEVKDLTEGDAKQLSPSDYKVRGSRVPLHPLFDAQGPSHYRVSLEAPEEKFGHQCAVLRFIPLKRTKRHFEGRAFIDLKRLDLIAIDGGLADTPFGVDEMRVRYRFRQVGPVIVNDGGQLRLIIDVPIVFPDNLITIDSKVLRAAPIPR